MSADGRATNYKEYDFRENPSRKLDECDLVMKGGITSGVVYPPAVLELATEYRFRSIGGSSAGAIAAALAAAAEYGRSEGGFNRLASSQEWVAQDKHLRNLFQPSGETRPLMETMLALMGKKPKGIARTVGNLYAVLMRKDPKAVLVGMVVGAGLSAIISLVFFVGPALLMGGSLNGWSFWLPMLLFGTIFGVGLGGISGGVYHLTRILTKKVPKENYWGICTGHSNDTSSLGVLTDWLSDRLDHLAGLSNTGDSGPREPLTFGHLENRGITLKMMTTNLNHGEPYVFPRESKTSSHEDEWEFVFNAGEMRALFPDYVVDYMIRKSESDRPQDEGEAAKEYYWLPRGNDLPVIVATRMSLSFPLLLSAIPLYQVWNWSNYAQNGVTLLTADDMHKNWFSDGGICSNFPIHFFDGWLPRRPTFGMNLTSMPDYMPGGELQERVFLPKANDLARSRPEWTEFKGLVGFAMAIFHSAQNYRDNMQSRLPSYLERIVQIRLGEEEGGLNLDMDSEMIKRLDGIGSDAGKKLRNDFVFNQHRWVRLLVLMEQLELNMNKVELALGAKTIDDLLKEQQQNPFPYKQNNDEWCDSARERIEQLRQFIEEWTPHEDEQGETPASWYFFHPVSTAEPQPELRMMPKV